MHLEHLLKQLKQIEPDKQVALRSRREILSGGHVVRPAAIGWRAVLSGMLQSGSAIAFTVLMVMIFAGGFSLMRFLETSGGLDIQSLKAEAQAIDIQIQLANVRYDNFGSAGTDNMKTPGKLSVTVHAIPSVISTATTTPPEVDATSTEVAATTTTDMSVDEALDALSKP